LEDVSTVAKFLIDDSAMGDVAVCKGLA